MPSGGRAYSSCFRRAYASPEQLLERLVRCDRRFSGFSQFGVKLLMLGFHRLDLGSFDFSLASIAELQSPSSRAMQPCYSKARRGLASTVSSTLYSARCCLEPLRGKRINGLCQNFCWTGLMVAMAFATR